MWLWNATPPNACRQFFFILCCFVIFERRRCAWRWRCACWQRWRSLCFCGKCSATVDHPSTGHWTRIRWKIQNNLIVHRTLWLWKMNERHTITPNKCNQYEWDAHQNRIEQGNSNVCSSSALFHLFCFYFSTLRIHIDELTSQTTFHFNDPFFIIYNPLHSRQNVWAAYRSIGLYDNKLNMLHAYICCSLFFSGRRKLAAPIIFTYYYDSNQIGLVHVIYSLSRIDTHKQPNAHAAIIV